MMSEGSDMSFTSKTGQSLAQKRQKILYLDFTSKKMTYFVIF